MQVKTTTTVAQCTRFILDCVCVCVWVCVGVCVWVGVCVCGCVCVSNVRVVAVNTYELVIDNWLKWKFHFNVCLCQTHTLLVRAELPLCNT